MKSYNLEGNGDASVTGIYSIEPALPDFGAFVTGFDLSEIGTVEELQPVLDLLHRYDVVVFRDQDFEPRQLAVLTRLMGEPEVHQLKPYQVPEAPEVTRLSNIVSGGRRIGNVSEKIVWHSDMQYLERPAAYTMLYGVEVPPEGGETWFVSAVLAYDALSQEDRELVDGLRVRHSGAKLYNNMASLSAKDREDMGDMGLAEVAHPAVRTHPATGRRALYISNPTTYVGMDGIGAAEGDLLHERLLKHQMESSPLYRHAWQPRDLVMWDNRTVVHTATPYDQARYTRLVYRTSVRGERPA